MNDRQPEHQPGKGGGSPVRTAAPAAGPARRPASGLSWLMGLVLAGAAYLAWIRWKEMSQPLEPGHLAVTTGLLMDWAGLGKGWLLTQQTCHTFQPK